MFCVWFLESFLMGCPAQISRVWSWTVQCCATPWAWYQVKGFHLPFLSVRTQDAINLLQKSSKTFLLLCFWLGEFDIYCHVCSLGSVSLLWVRGLSWRPQVMCGFSAEFGGLWLSLYFFLHILSSLYPSLSFWGFSASRISAEGSPQLPRAGAFPIPFLSWSKPETGLQGGKDHQRA